MNAFSDDRIRELASFAVQAKSRREASKLVAQALFLDHGQVPSARIVRSITQRGSLRDVLNDLREFWDDVREAYKQERRSDTSKSEVLVEKMGQGGGEASVILDRLTTLEQALKFEANTLKVMMDRSRSPPPPVHPVRTVGQGVDLVEHAKLQREIHRLREENVALRGNPPGEEA